MMQKFWVAIGTSLYWIMLPAIWVYARNTKPRARVILVCQGQVLVVKNWLGAGGWSLPGGGLESHEQADAAAVREISEELGISIESDKLLSLGEYTAVERGRLKSRYYLYGYEFQHKPEITPAKSEIVDHTWLDFDYIRLAKKGVGNTVKQSVVSWLDR